MTRSAIQWTDRVWNPVTGCSKVSEGCRFCYAESWSRRQVGPWRGRRFEDVRTHEERLDAPLRWRKGARVFVNSMSDLFHGYVPDAFIDRVCAVMLLAERHTFQVLTKRPELMRDYLRSPGRREAWARAVEDLQLARCTTPSAAAVAEGLRGGWRGMPDHIHVGVSIESKETAGQRIPLLLDTPAVIRWISAEPLLGPIDLFEAGGLSTVLREMKREHEYGRGAGRDWLDWIVVGGESGPGARPCEVQWIRNIVEQARRATTPCFVKQLGSCPIVYRHEMLAFAPCDLEWDDSGEDISARLRLRDRKGGDPEEWPPDLQVREVVPMEETPR